MWALSDSTSLSTHSAAFYAQACMYVFVLHATWHLCTFRCARNMGKRQLKSVDNFLFSCFLFVLVVIPLLCMLLRQFAYKGATYKNKGDAVKQQLLQSKSCGSIRGNKEVAAAMHCERSGEAHKWSGSARGESKNSSELLWRFAACCNNITKINYNNNSNNNHGI